MTESKLFYTKENLDRLWNSYDTVRGKYDDLKTRYLTKRFEIEQAREFANHGFCRRLGILVHCIDGVFKALPPDLDRRPERGQILDATVCLQAFVLNVYGCIDNLAWIWVLEKKIKRDDGTPLPKSWVGFGTNNSEVLKSLSEIFREYLGERRPWLNYIVDFRHALAHRIPLYIPPYVVPTDKIDKYNDLEVRIAKETADKNYEEADNLSGEQELLTSFTPIITHSFSEKAPSVNFHQQMLVDFFTVEEFAQKLLEEFDR